MNAISNELYVDGGVIGRNPSKDGITWAARWLRDNQVVQEASGFLTCREAGISPLGNNTAELLAMVQGLELLPDDWCGTIYSDSNNTLGRTFLGWKLNEVPLFLKQRLWNQQKRLRNWSLIHYQLLDGHPNEAQLLVGIGKRGSPVSIHNVWCDHMCNQQADRARGVLA